MGIFEDPDVMVFGIGRGPEKFDPFLVGNKTKEAICGRFRDSGEPSLDRECRCGEHEKTW